MTNNIDVNIRTYAEMVKLGKNMCCEDKKDEHMAGMKKTASAYVKSELIDYLKMMRDKLEKKNVELRYAHRNMVHATTSYNTVYAEIDTLEKKILQLQAECDLEQTNDNK